MIPEAETHARERWMFERPQDRVRRILETTRALCCILPPPNADWGPEPRGLLEYRD